MPETASAIKSFRLVVFTEKALALKGEDACAKFFDASLTDVPSVVKTSFSFASTQLAAPAIDVLPGKSYVLVLEGWNIDPPPEAAAPAGRVVAIACVHDLAISARKTTTLAVKVCIVGTRGALNCPR